MSGRTTHFRVRRVGGGGVVGEGGEDGVVRVMAAIYVRRLLRATVACVGVVFIRMPNLTQTYIQHRSKYKYR